MQVRGTPFPKDRYAEATSIKNAIMVGSPQQIIEKILYQHELYRHNRWIVQIDYGDMPFKKVMKVIELFATEVAPDFAVGDICTNDGKVNLIATGLGEASVTVNSAKFHRKSMFLIVRICLSD